jgi:parvulin-like peptidyl-prolyl isomerase
MMVLLGRAGKGKENPASYGASDSPVRSAGQSLQSPDLTTAALAGGRFAAAQAVQPTHLSGTRRFAMRIATRFLLAGSLAAAFGWPIYSQQTPPGPATAAKPAGVAATVNGESISEVAVQRGLKRVPPDKHAEARPEVLEFLVDNALIEQNLKQLAIPVEKKEIDSMIDKIKNAIAEDNATTKQKHTFEEFMKELMLDESELRNQIAADLRWEKFVNRKADEKELRKFFDQNKDMFDGTLVRARHILLTPKSGDAQEGAKAQQQLAAWKKQIEEQAVAGVAKLPAGTDPLEKEKARVKLIEDGFAAIAQKESACPSKAKGGDIGQFPRAGSMVEPFAKAAFALKPYQISDPVKTQFGYHLILSTEKKPGTEPKFDVVKDEVKEVLALRFRQELVVTLRGTAKIVVTPAKP